MKTILFFLLTSLITPVCASEEVPEDIVIIKENTIQFNSESDQLNLEFEINVKEDFFAYKDKFEINSSYFNVLGVEMDPVVSFFDKTFQKTKRGVKKNAKFKVPITFTSQGSDINKVDFELVYQACTTEYCLFPAHLKVSHILTESEKKNYQNSTSPDWLKKGLFLSLLFVFLAGFLTSLTPCVYPMLPITLAVLGANKSTSKLDGFIKSLTYVLGMALTYASLGLLAASSGFMFGSLLSNHYFLGFLAFVLFLGALSMFDVFEIQTPHILGSRLSVNQKSTSYFTLFITGLFSGLVVGPCVGPVLVGVLGYVSQTGDLFLGFSLLFSFALGLGSLILVLGTFSELLDKLPRSGNWMVLVKKALGFIFLGLILYFVSPVVTMKQFVILGLTLFVLFVLVLLFKNYKQKNSYLSVIEAAFYRSVLIFSILFIGVSMSLSNERFERLIGYSTETFANTHWDVFTEEKLRIAKDNEQYVVLDFYADWCAACRELKHKTFSDPKVSGFSKKIKWLYFDSTKPSAKLKELKEKYKVLGLPTILFFDKGGTLRNDIRLTGFEKPSLFIERLKKLTQKE